MRYCPKYTRILATEDDGKQLMTRSRCRSYRCRYCSSKNAITLRKEVAALVKSLPSWNWYFCTITTRGGDERNPQNTFNALKKGLGLMCKDTDKAIQKAAQPKRPREYKTDAMRLVWRGDGMKGFEYLAVYERHEDGNWHAHIIIGIEGKFEIERERQKRSDKIDLSLWLSEYAFKHGMGYIADAQKIMAGDGVKNITYYITKATRYMTKKPQVTTDFLPPKARLIQCSRGFSAIVLDGSDKAWFVRPKLTISDIMKETWIDVNLGKTLTSDDIDEYGVYPPISEHIDE